MLIELAPLLSALLMWLAFPPVGWGALAIVAPTPLLAALRRVKTRGGAAALGFVYGVAFYGLLLWWVKFAGYLAVVPLVMILAGWSTLYALLVFSARTWSFTSWWIVAVGGWALMEWLRAHVPFGGLPWGLSGYGAAEYSWMRGSAQFIGVTGWSVVFMGIAAGLAIFVTDRRRPTGWLVPSLGVGVLLTLIGTTTLPEATGPSLRVAIVQGSTPCPGFDCPNESADIFQSHLDLTRTLGGRTVDLVVWAESAVGSSVELRTNPDRAAQVGVEAQRLDAHFLIGSQRNLSADAFSNLNLLVTPDGELGVEYRKQHPVPFGEYVPLRSLLDWMPILDQTPRDMERGTEFTVFPLPDGVVGSVISFEGAFPRSVRPIMRQDSQLLVVTSNEASYSNSPASDQFINMTRMRAAESAVAVVHAAITGKSAFIDAGGAVISSTDLFDEDVLRGTVRFSEAGTTLYTRFGDWVQYLAIAGLLVTVAKQRLASRKPADQHVSS